jgi:hypothetical protein
MRPASVQEVSVTGNVAIGIAHASRQDFSKGPPTIPPEPDIPQLEIMPEPFDELFDIPEPEVEPDLTVPEPSSPDEDTAISELPPDERLDDAPMYADEPMAREQSPPQPVNSILGPTPKNASPYWRDQWNALQARLPDKNNRG